MIEDNMPLVRFLAGKYCGGEMASYREDICSVGAIGLMKAVDTFNPERGVAFGAYASRCIKNEMFQYINKLKKNSAMSLDAEIDTGARLMDMLADARMSVEECLDTQCDRRALYASMRVLTYNERNAVMMYFIEGKKQAQIARVLNITQAAVSKCIASALPKMRVYLREYV